MGLGCSCFCLPFSSCKRSSNLKDNSTGFPKSSRTQSINKSSTKTIKMQFLPEETPNHQFEEQKEFATFKEWLLAEKGIHSSNKDETLQRNFVKQTKVHPSLVEYCSENGYVPRRSYSMNRLLTGGEVDSCRDKYYHTISSSSKNQIKKIRKTVSFRFPEEADIFVYNRAEDDY